jgi:hypothetical protein
VFKIITMTVQTCFGHGPNTRGGEGISKLRPHGAKTNHIHQPSKKNPEHSLTQIGPWKEIEFDVSGVL